MESDSLDNEVVFKTKTGQTTTQMVVFKPSNDSLEKLIPRTILLGEDKFETVRRDDKKENCNESNLALTCKVVGGQRPTTCTIIPKQRQGLPNGIYVNRNHLKFMRRLFIFRGILLVGILPRNILLRGIFLRRDFAGRDFSVEGFCERDFPEEGLLAGGI